MGVCVCSSSVDTQKGLPVGGVFISGSTEISLGKGVVALKFCVQESLGIPSKSGLSAIGLSEFAISISGKI